MRRRLTAFLTVPAMLLSVALPLGPLLAATTTRAEAANLPAARTAPARAILIDPVSYTVTPPWRPPHRHVSAGHHAFIRPAPKPAHVSKPRPKPKPTTLFDGAPHTHAGLVTWSRSLPWPWPGIVRCESLRDDSWPQSSSSQARGVFQFLRSSWRMVGGTGDPAAAPWREQYRRAKDLARRFGLRSWDCARQLGYA